MLTVCQPNFFSRRTFSACGRENNVCVCVCGGGGGVQGCRREGGLAPFKPALPTRLTVETQKTTSFFN